jgi:hypothetical protein
MIDIIISKRMNMQKGLLVSIEFIPPSSSKKEDNISLLKETNPFYSYHPGSVSLLPKAPSNMSSVADLLKYSYYGG